MYQISQNLTAEQKAIADYWADGAGTVTPPGHWNVIAIDLLRGPLVNPSHRPALRGAEHGTSGCLHRVLGR